MDITIIIRTNKLSALNQLHLLQLSDSALPIGASAHSFGLETLTAEGALMPENLSSFFTDLLKETAPLEAAYCRRAYQIVTTIGSDFASAWSTLNQTLSARKPARESRDASTTLGKRFLRLVAGLEPHTTLDRALQCQTEIHHCTAFGLVGGVLALGEEQVVLAYLQQNLTGLLSACQRLMPVGQMQAMTLSWQLKPLLVEIAQQSNASIEQEVYTFSPLLDLAGMRHANLPVRLFIS